MLRGQLSPLPLSTTQRTTTPPTLRASPPSNSTHPLIHITDNRFWQASARSPAHIFHIADRGRKKVARLPSSIVQPDLFLAFPRIYRPIVWPPRLYATCVEKGISYIYIFLVSIATISLPSVQFFSKAGLSCPFIGGKSSREKSPPRGWYRNR